MGHVASLPIKLKAHYITQLLEVGVGFTPSEKKAASPERVQLATGKPAPRSTPLQPPVSDMAVSQPMVFEMWLALSQCLQSFLRILF